MCYRGAIVGGHIICPECGQENPLERTHCQECEALLVPEWVIKLLSEEFPDVPVQELRIPR